MGADLVVEGVERDGHAQLVLPRQHLGVVDDEGTGPLLDSEVPQGVDLVQGALERLGVGDEGEDDRAVREARRVELREGELETSSLSWNWDASESAFSPTPSPEELSERVRRGRERPLGHREAEQQCSATWDS